MSFVLSMLFVVIIPEIVYSEYKISDDRSLSTDGITLWEQIENNMSPDYILEIDLRKADFYSAFGNVLRVDIGSFGGRSPHYEAKSIRLAEFKTPSGETPFAIYSGMFGGGWTPRYESGSIAFPVRHMGFLETEGYGDPEGNTPDYAATSAIKYRVLCIDNQDGKAYIYSHYRLDNIQKCMDECVSFSADVIKRDTGGKTFIGVADRNNDDINETILIFSSERASRSYADSELRAFGALNTMQFDGGGSSQLWVNQSYLVKSPDARKDNVWHAFVISQKIIINNISV